MSKKLIALACVLCFFFVLTACSNSESNENTQGTGTPSATVTEQPTNTPTEAPTSTPTEAPTPNPIELPTPHEHSYTSTTTKEATCSEVGETTYTCSCGDTYIEDIAKISHIESDWIVVTEVVGATNGLQHKVCTVCGVELVTEEIYPEVVASGVLAEGRIGWKIIGTTLYVDGTGAIPDFEHSGAWFSRWAEQFPDKKPIAWEMFYTDVDNIVLSEGITAIGQNNFCDFSKVTSFNFPSTITKIGKYGMNGMGITSLEIPRTITSIDIGAFQNLANITELVIPSNIKTIPNYCFPGCYNLSKIVIEEGVTMIGEFAFGMAPSIGENGERIGLCDGFEIYVPESVTKIGDYAFATGESKGPITVYGKAGSYVEQWIKTKNVQSEVTFVAK